MSRDVTYSRTNHSPRPIHSVGHDQAMFSGSADRTHVINTMRNPMRGGIRL